MTVVSSMILLVFALLALAIWNFIIFRRIRASSRSENGEIKDSKYWELQYKMDYLVAVAAMGAAVLVFLGYESLQSAKATARSEIDEELSVVRRDIANANDDISRAEATLETLKLLTDSVRGGVSISGAQVSSQLRALKELRRRIEEINSRNIVQQEFYVVRSIKVKTDGNRMIGSSKFYFKDLIDESGDRLPRFADPPLIIPIAQADIVVNSFHVQDDSFELYLTPFLNAMPENLNVSVVIIGK